MHSFFCVIKEGKDLKECEWCRRMPQFNFQGDYFPNLNNWLFSNLSNKLYRRLKIVFEEKNIVFSLNCYLFFFWKTPIVKCGSWHYYRMLQFRWIFKTCWHVSTLVLKKENKTGHGLFKKPRRTNKRRWHL